MIWKYLVIGKTQINKVPVHVQLELKTDSIGEAERVAENMFEQNNLELDVIEIRRV
jgi:hypothetical protein